MRQQESILLENSRRKLVGRGSRHVDMQCHFVTDQIERKHVEVRCCPMQDTIADFFAEPLQQASFCQLGGMIHGIDENDMEEHQRDCNDALEKLDLVDS